MNILIIDNNTEYLGEIKNSLRDNKLTVQKYKPGIKFNTAGQELVVLSGGGGEGKEANDQTKTGRLWYQDEINFIKNAKLPVIGICMGFELIAQAHGAKVKKLPRGISGWRRVMLNSNNPWNLKKLWQFESHDYSVNNLPESQFDIIGSSCDGAELIQHKSRPIVATQFHPEIHGSTLRLNQLLKFSTS